MPKLYLCQRTLLNGKAHHTVDRTLFLSFFFTALKKQNTTAVALMSLQLLEKQHEWKCIKILFNGLAVPVVRSHTIVEVSFPLNGQMSLSWTPMLSNEDCVPLNAEDIHCHHNLQCEGSALLNLTYMTQSTHVILPTPHIRTWSAMLTVSPCSTQYFPQSPTVSQCSHKKSETEEVTALL
jgi:hypothetical protein